ncbi:MAG: thioredoxin [Nitrososphaerales archaeon]
MSDPELERILEEKAKLMKERIKKLPMETKETLNLSSKNFWDVINSSEPVIVDFWAEWCTPCKYMLPIFEKLAAKYSDKMIFARLNVDECSDIANKYQVLSIPTFIIFLNGKPVDMVVGAVGEKKLEKVIKKYTNSLS